MSGIRFHGELPDLAEHALRELVQPQLSGFTQLPCQLTRHAPVLERLADRGIAVDTLDGNLVALANAAMRIAPGERHDAYPART